MTMQQLLIQAQECLKKAGVPNAGMDARYLLLESFGMSLASFLAVRGQELPEDEAVQEKCRKYKAFIEKREKRIPLQYLIGVQEFMGLSFTVNEHVLIPRQDTETLVELVLKEMPDQAYSVLDVCTGSGCIAVSLAALGGYRSVTALDISPDALAVAGENAGKLLSDYRGSFRLLESDMLREVRQEERFDVIVSNPPYIPTNEIDALQPEVSFYEPRLALDGTEDGLEFYRILAEECRSHLKPQGRIYMEIGCSQAEDVKRIFETEGYVETEVFRDMAGLDRVVRAVWNDCTVKRAQNGGKYV